MPKTTRAFIAIALNEHLHKELQQLQGKLKISDADVKWVAPSNIHLTLKFLGNITDEQIQQVKDAISTAVSGVKPYNIHLAEIGAFPKIAYPRVIWAGMDKGGEETSKIYNKLEEELEKIKFPKEKRAFSAHLTLGRVRSPKNRGNLTEAIEKQKKFSSSAQLKVREITLFQSKLSPKGPTHEALFTANLS